MADCNLNSLSNPLRNPSLPLFRRDIGSKHRYADAFPHQNGFESPCDITFSGIDGVHMTAAAAHLEFTLHDLHQAPFLGINELLIQFLRLGDQESFSPLSFRIVLVAIEVSDVPGVIRIQK